MFPRTQQTTRWSRPLAGIALIFFVLALSGCSKPLLEGPQITKLPYGFMMDANASGAGNLFAGREEQREFGYFCLGADDEHSSIMITTYAGKTTYEEAQTAYGAENGKRSYHRFGPIETLTIDGQTAWGWLVTQYVKEEVSSLKLVAVIPYEKDETTYVVEFYSSQEKFRDEAFMKETLATFRVKKERVSYGKIGAFVVLAVGFVGIMTRIKKERPA